MGQAAAHATRMQPPHKNMACNVANVKKCSYPRLAWTLYLVPRRVEGVEEIRIGLIRRDIDGLRGLEICGHVLERPVGGKE